MLLWLILGLVLGAVLLWLATRASLRFTWYEWLLAALALVLLLFTVQNYFASLTELEPRAAGFMLLLFGLPGLILVVVDSVLVWLRLRKPKVAAK